MSSTLTPESNGRLVNLKTNLKSLRFGGDRPNSGTSNQPYMVEPIPGQIIDGNTEGLGGALDQGIQFLENGLPPKSGPDFLLRGGLLAPLYALKDTSRLVKMFTDDKSPRGLQFILKENLLSRTSVKTQSSFGVGYLAGVMNQGAYLPIGTLLQAGFGWAGAHLNKNGINPIGALGGPSGMIRGIDNPLKSEGSNQVGVGGGAINLYSAVVKNDQDEAINRLTNLQFFVETGEKGKSRKQNKQFQKEQGLNVIQRALKNNGARFTYNPTANKENPKSPILYSYGGGPGSILGVGKTNIFREQPTYNAIRNYQNLSTTSPIYSGVQPDGKSTILYGTGLLDYAGQALGDQRFLFPRNFTNQVIKNESYNDTTVSKIIHASPDYQTQNKSLRVNMGDPGQHATYAVSGSEAVVRNVFNYGIPANQMSALDKITALKPYLSKGVDPLLPTDDLVNFNIAIMSNGNFADGLASYLHFRAYITGFTDNYGAEWNDVQYVGRGNKFKNYSGFSRDISLNFTVAATSKAELIPMFTKLNLLASSLAPDYNSAGFMRGNMVQMTVGGYLFETPGVITSLTYNIPDDSTWEVGIGTSGGEDPSVKQLPHRIEVTLAFSPIEDFLPSLQTLEYDETTNELTSMGPQRFISLANSNNNNYDGDTGIPTYKQPNKNPSIK
tara:strand:+ start:266 stop:2269 length:2004 start_codon:yes stop_codon:yes gene_type:complete